MLRSSLCEGEGAVCALFETSVTQPDPDSVLMSIPVLLPLTGAKSPGDQLSAHHRTL